jgi:hypothetical protein
MDKAIGLAVGAVLVSGLGAGGATVVRHHHAGHHAAPPAAAPVVSGSESAFIDAVLTDLGVPAGKRQADATSLAAWFPHEFPSFPPAAAWNPMASTLQMPGSTIYNGVGVQNYTDPSEGAQATALTLADGWYPHILAALKSGNGLCGNPSLTGDFLVWSGNGYSGVC